MVLSRRLVERGEERGDFCGFSLSLSFVRSVGGSLDRAKYHLPGLNQCHAAAAWLQAVSVFSDSTYTSKFVVQRRCKNGPEEANVNVDVSP